MVDLASGATGAATGAMFGSTFGPIGTAAGSVIGGGLGLFKKKKKKKKMSTFDAGQQDLYSKWQAAINGEGPLADMYNYNPDMLNENFDKNVSRPAYRNFEENIIPQITGQFRGNNLQNSSYAGQALGRAGRDVQEGLDAQRSSAHYSQMRQSQSDRMGAIDKLLNMNTQVHQQRSDPLDDLFRSAGPKAAEWIFDYLKGGQKAA